MLGALCSALFTAYAIEGVPIAAWGRELVNKILPKAYQYMKKMDEWEDYYDSLYYFEEKVPNTFSYFLPAVEKIS